MTPGDQQETIPKVTAFLTTLIACIVGCAAVKWYGRRRPMGAPLTWGEAIAAAAFVWFMLVLAYGMLPHYFLTWADQELAWRSDKIGIPLGPLGGLLYPEGKGTFIGWPVDKNLLWPQGVTFFGGGYLIVTAETIRYLLVFVLYLLAMAGQFWMWRWWKSRVKAVAKRKQKALGRSVSSFGRPLRRVGELDPRRGPC